MHSKKLAGLILLCLLLVAIAALVGGLPWDGGLALKR
jgi:hypothetical protein